MITLSLQNDLIDGFCFITAMSGGSEIYRLNLCRDDINGPMSVKEHPTLLTASRIAANLVTANAGNFAALQTFFAGIEDASAYAQTLGYNLTDWLT